VGAPVKAQSAEVDRAQEVQENIKKGCSAIRGLWVALASYLYEFFEGKMWTTLGYETFNEWLATPEIDLGRTQVYALVEAYRELVIERGVDPETLGAIDVSKIAVVLPALRAGAASLEEALSDCETLSRSDLREKYGQQLPEKTGGEGGSKAQAGPSLEECEQCGRMVEASC
jgi:hypothetical protein